MVRKATKHTVADGIILDSSGSKKLEHSRIKNKA